MAYNPYGYQQYYQQQNAGMVWVQGEQAAKSFLVAPGQTVALWDSENPVIYLKTVDHSGLPSMRVIDYKVRSDTQAKTPLETAQRPADNDIYVTKEELKELKEALEMRLNKLTGGIKDESAL